MIMLRRIRLLLVLTALAGLGGCATTGAGSNDPLEGYNRAMFGINDAVDKVIVKPVASGYKAVMPEFARTGVTNFFANLGDIWIGINNVLQGKVGAGVSDLGRFAINSTIGIVGLIDVASKAGLEKHNEDFGQTLGRWGVGSGAYVVLPFFGPSNVRDGFSRLVIDWHGDPLWYVGNVPTRNELIGVRVIDDRANLLDVSRLAEEAALDHYAYVRDAYLQRRRSLIYDGNPPPESNPEKSSDFDADEKPAARAEADLPKAQILTIRGERVITAADEELTPAREFARTQVPPVAPRKEAAAASAGAVSTDAASTDAMSADAMSALSKASGSVYEPKIPNNQEALLANSAGARAGFLQTSLKP
jgi:phospholipid-binding lipoprotein MlaA